MADTVKVRFFKNYMDADTQVIYEGSDEGAVHEIPRAFFERLMKKRYRVEPVDIEPPADVERRAAEL